MRHGIRFQVNKMLSQVLRSSLFSAQSLPPFRARSFAAVARHQQEKRRELFDRVIRVDHAGEYGADRIYAGQMTILANSGAGETIQHMWEQEKEHLRLFNDLIDRHRTRPSALLPIWNVAGFALGAGSALLGEKMAMACTIAVETVIMEHYDTQMKALEVDDSDEGKELLEIIKKCRDDEEHHHDLGIEHEGMDAPLYSIATCAIKTGCKIAIAIAERV
ncbi:5-demethoxyubiquinone hydroxylase, mitochondrial [Galendromus occidentalis]|uniref:5-demethoxyubiquinone hydroxylase, mitochondrial n=1 Tax=Galendromus occidentalis TaxID=34638 RepID=A0AAJ7L897_9ACAR|nr:5-demethoxyubiquinone hydroxylase, mitochondrial [Galendromus occidentalis]